MSIHLDDKVSFKLLCHKDLSFFNQAKIIRLKQRFWKYSFINHYRWYKKNFHSSDYHLLMCLENKFIGYLSIQLDLVMDSKNLYSGIGSVIIKNQFRGKGFSRLLIGEAVRFISSNKGIAMLICKDNLRSYYQQMGFTKFEGVTLHEGKNILCNLMMLPKSDQKAINLTKLF